jgi:Mrp family chromosome partitioning ATPase
MTSTDSAFIRAYNTRRATHADRSSAGVASASLGISMSQTVIPAPHASFSEIVTPAHPVESVPASKQVVSSNSDGPVTAQSVRTPQRQPQPGPPTTSGAARAKTFTLGPVTPDRIHLRFDSQSAHDAPHIKMPPAGVQNVDESIRAEGSPTALRTSEPEQTKETKAPGIADSAPTFHRYDAAVDADFPGAHSLVEFHSNWEVDAFHWPEICNRLQGESTAGLSGLLRSVLHRAWRGRHVFALTSFSRGEGGTTVALCLAKLAAMFDVKVALVDGNVAAPKLVDELGVAAEHGWSELDEATSLSEISIRSVEDNMVVVPLKPGLNPRELTCLHDRATATLEQLAQSFELVLIDAGPIYHAAHLWMTQPTRDAIHGGIVVRNMQLTSPEQADDVCFRLQQANIRDVLVVENFQQSSRESVHV